MKFFTTIIISFVAFFPNFEAALDPPCSPVRTKPQCTHDKSQVTDTFPICCRPITEFDNCRAIPGMRFDPKVPKWFDYNWARRGQEITSEYRLPWYYNMFNGLLVEMIMPDIRNNLLFNKKNIDGMANAKRDLATIMQGMVWTKDYLRKMPEEGHSNWINSIQSVRNVHKDVQTRGYDRVSSKGCLIDTMDYDTVETDDEAWDAFEADMEASKLLEGRRYLPQSSWLTCADVTTCKNCDSCKCPDGATACTECKNCKDCAWKTKRCDVATPTTFDCESCTCSDGGKKCETCINCTNYERCLNYTVPLYNQQALGFVVYNLVGFTIIWPNEIGINACEPDLWAFNHLWAGILSMLGVEDDCNLLLHPDIDTARVYYQAVFDNYLLPTMFKFDKPTRFLLDNVFKGLSILTGTAFTPKLLLCRFLRDFVRIEPKKMCGILDPKEKLLDTVVSGMMIPQFMNDSTYRALLNKGMDDKFQDDSNRFFPGGECESFKRIPKECLA